MPPSFSSFNMDPDPFSTGPLSTSPAVFSSTPAPTLYQPTPPLHNIDLHSSSIIGSANPPLTRTEIATHLYMLASAYAFEEEFVRRDEARIKSNGDLQDVFQDLKIRLEDTFDVTNEQHTTIRCVAQDIIFQKNRTSFCQLFVEVMGALRRDKVTLKMTHIFDLPGREKRLQSVVKKITSSVRNAFRQDIRDSITGNETKSLKNFHVRCRRQV
ncbi:hypothetical protein C8R42DRAFT_644507 [Lentinula raphanica]|nr:hypothetical protein C8R42DRAFT_644507 [Lentinula raphanica]